MSLPVLDPPLTSKLIEKLCEHVGSHIPIVTAYRMEGVADATFSSWMSKAEEEPDSIFYNLKRHLEQAEALAEAEAAKGLNALCDEGLAAAIMWRQERRYGWTKSEGRGPDKDKGTSAASAPTIVLPPNGRETPRE